MSGYLWTALPPNVRGSIDTQPDGDAATKECGCDNRGGKWWLCQYHSGFHDAETALIDRLETELSRSHGKARWGCGQCTEGDDATDTGERSLYVDSRGKREALKEALRRANAKLEVGGMLAMQYTGDGEAERGMNPPKEYRAEYAAPAPATGVDSAVANLL